MPIDDLYWDDVVRLATKALIVCAVLALAIGYVHERNQRVNLEAARVVFSGCEQ